MLVSKDLAVGKEIHRGAWRWAESKGWKVTRLNGGQEVEAPGENRWLLRADTAVYGYDVGYGQVDESWGVDPASITDGLEPALLERFWPQLHLTSTAHVKATSLMRRRLTAALRDADQDVLLLIWGARPDADLSLEQTWRDASPHWSDDRRALIARKYNAALAGQDEPEFDDPDPIRGWAAQYLNVWPLLRAVKRERGTSWVAAEAYRLQVAYDCPVVIDARGPAAPLIRDLEQAGVVVTSTNTDEYVAACAKLFDAVADSGVSHGDYPELNEAVSAASKRSVGDRWAWARRNGDISMLEAVTLALSQVQPSVYEEREMVIL
jgi:hypothetical protein